MRHHQISKQSFKIITQYGDMLVVKQGIQHHHHQSHHHHAHHHPVASASGQAGGSGHQWASTNEQQSAAGAQQQQQQQQQQQPSRPIIMTFHDLGLNSELQFASFCECDEVKLMLQTFTMIHVNFIGQEFDQPISGSNTLVAASSLPDDFKYPTVEQMAECIVDICAQLRVRSFVALAVGAGAHIVSTLALIRPDLVHGLFLINPVVSSCSITEWLYFKMSALASNHQILGSHHNTAGSGGHQQSSGSISLAGSLGSGSSASHGAVDDQQRNSTTGLRRLWNAVHHHHHHHDNNNNSHNDNESSSQHRHSSSSNSLGNSPQKLPKKTEPLHGEESPQCGRANSPPASSPPATSRGPGGGGGGHQKPAAGSRLRNLILSRNFLHGKHNTQHQSPTGSQQQACSGDDRPQSYSSSKLPKDGNEQQHSPASIRRSSSVSSPSRPSSGRRRLSGGSVASSSSWSGKRPPFEYLMYHHFGVVSFQRLRRLSSDAHTELLEKAGRFADSTAGSKSRLDNLQDTAGSQHNNHRASCDSAASGQSGKSGQLAATIPSSLASQTETMTTATSVNSAAKEHDQSQESLLLMKTRRRHQRSSSVCLSPGYLASISSDRQRAQYMQTVYKQYFAQLNSHNLWLFAQSFVKRKTLSLRKDCGAAAHAAAAAAALGTSICVAFVGLGPVSTRGGSGGAEGGGGGGGGGGCEAVLGAQSTSGEETGGRNLSSGKVREDSSQDSSSQQQRQREINPEISLNTPTAGPTPSSSTTATTSQSKPAHQSVLVAGTKVKRTFTCQTLIMCSSVHNHHDRALKLMSLLNPLQATWIKTDQLLVLEEKPEKVCQALRLFLQGIGYSMSTYERRLRLCSAQASVSSADSNGSNDSATNSSTPSKTTTTARQLRQTTSVSASERAG